MKPAIIINTHLRPHYLETTLRLFEHQGAKIVVSDSGERTEEMGRILDIIKTKSYVEFIEPPPGEIRFLHQRWNAALEKLLPEGYDPIFVTDDALIPSWNLIPNMTSLMEDEPNISIVGPIHQAGVDVQYPLPQDGHVLQKLGYDPINLERFSKTLQERADSSSLRFKTSIWVESHIRAIRAQVFKDLGLFDDHYWIGYYGDSEFCYDVRQKGWEVAVCYKALIWHYRERFYGMAKKQECISHDTAYAFKRWGNGDKLAKALRKDFTERRG